MSDEALRTGEGIVRTIAETAMENEKDFSELDAVVGDGDFGYSLARGFEIVLSEFNELEYDDAGGLLKKTALVLTKRIGGTSGPIWGTAFLRAGATLSGNPDPSGADVIAALRASIDELEQALQEGAPDALQRAAVKARESAEATKGMLAQRGRASYTGERSRDSVDAGAIGIAVMFLVDKSSSAAPWEYCGP